MANNNVQAQEIESLNISEAFFVKYKKAIMIAVVALIVIIAGVFAYMSQVLVRTRQAHCSARVRPISRTRCMSRHSTAMALAT